MKITGLPVLNLAMRRHADARKAIERWMAEAAKASWKSFQDVKSTYGGKVDAPLIDGCRIVIFNLKGNDYRLLVSINYAEQAIRILFFLTHAEYSKNQWRSLL